MIVVRIKKSFRGGRSVNHIVLFDEPYSNDDIEYSVEDWCENDAGGAEDGYTCEWDIETDEAIINDTLNKKLKNINDSIVYLNTQKNKIENFLK